MLSAPLRREDTAGGDLPAVPALAGTIELAAMFGVKTQTAYEWRSDSMNGRMKHPLPEPRIVSGSPVWSEAELVAWGEVAGKTYDPQWRAAFPQS